MAVSDFSPNYTDRSNDYGFQFEFYCQKCNNGFLTDFKASKLGIAAGIIRGLGWIMGGRAYRWGHMGHEVKDALRGPAWDTAFREAVEACKKRFKQCGRCGIWVCPERCWNPKHSLCENCAPELAEEASALSARKAVEKLEAQASPEYSILVCESCGHENESGKFCGHCGKPLGAAGDWKCKKCGKSSAESSRFCGECGAPKS